MQCLHRQYFTILGHEKAAVPKKIFMFKTKIAKHRKCVWWIKAKSTRLTAVIYKRISTTILFLRLRIKDVAVVNTLDSHKQKVFSNAIESGVSESATSNSVSITV